MTPAGLALTPATEDDAPAIAGLRNGTAERLTREFGQGHWSSAASEKGVRNLLKTPQVYVVRQGTEIVATLRLQTKKPWAIDVGYFTAVGKALYLIDMAVASGAQRQGIGRRCLDEARHIARAWPADAIRLDAYDADAGAGPFYAKCGFRETGRVVYRKVPLIYYEALL